jgi:transcriptional accessory protein Tex/SPT6
MKKVIVDYSRERDAEMHSFANIIIQHMDGNKYFPAPSPTVADFSATVASYGTALTDAGNRDRQAVGRKNTLKAAVADGLRQWAMYVNTVSQGNMDMLISSNFKEVKDREPVHLAVPVIKSVMQGINPGTLVASIFAVKGAKGYNYQIAKDPITETTEWETYGDSRTKFTFSNLEQGQKYWIRVIAIGSNNQAVQSSEVAQYVMQRTMAAAKAA